MGWGWVRRTFFLLGNPFAFLMLDYFSVDLARILFFFFFSLFFCSPFALPSTPSPWDVSSGGTPGSG
jgi:hypothetical protein